MQLLPKMNFTGLLSVGLIMLGALNAPRSVQADQLLTVQLTSGRQFTGHVDTRTDENHLWLRFGNQSVILLRPIEWNRVQSGLHEGQTLTSDQLRDAVGDWLAETAAEAPGTAPEQEELTVAAPGWSTQLDESRPTIADQALAALRATPRVRSVQVDVQLGSWDSDVEVDGLLVHIYPLDEHGHLVAVDGTVSVELFAPVHRNFGSAPHARGHATQQLARWTEVVSAEAIGPDGAVFKLAFQNTHPDFDLDVASFGLVHVRLAVPGHGVFDQSIDGIRIRPFAPVRDLLEQSTGRRFLPYERTGR